MTRQQCQRLDADDPLAPVRDRFELPDGVIYLDGNSLGALPRGVAHRLQATVREQWGSDLIRAWESAGWLDLPRRVGDRIARLVGAGEGTVIAGDSTSVNLFKVVSAAVDLRSDRTVILTDDANFPTDVHVMSQIAGARGLELAVVPSNEVGDHLGSSVAMLALTEVDYRTGRRHDMAALTAEAHRAGALVVWDLAHSAGAFPVHLAACDVDFAVGCGYKFLNGGPGAPAYAYVAPRHQDEFVNPIAGWFGHRAPFDFDPVWHPGDGIGRARVGTPHILSLAALDAALDVFDDVDLDVVAAKSEALTELFMGRVDQDLPGFEIVTPRDPGRRGSQVSLRHPDAGTIVWRLIERGVIGDFRPPDIARFGFAPLYVRYVDAWDAVDRVLEVT